MPKDNPHSSFSFDNRQTFRKDLAKGNGKSPRKDPTPARET